MNLQSKTTWTRIGKTPSEDIGRTKKVTNEEELIIMATNLT